MASPQLPTTTPELPRSDLPVIPGRPNLFPEPAPIVPVVVPEWVASIALVQNPAAIDNPLTVAAAAAEMKRFNATWHATSLDPDSVIDECRAAMSNMFSACSAMVGNELAPIRPETPSELGPSSQLLSPDRWNIRPNPWAYSEQLLKIFPTVDEDGGSLFRPALCQAGRVSLPS